MKTIEDLALDARAEVGGDLDSVMASDLTRFARRLFALRDAEAVPVGKFVFAESSGRWHQESPDCLIGQNLYLHASAPSELEAEVGRLQWALMETEALELSHGAVIGKLRQQLAESQAREMKLREWVETWCRFDPNKMSVEEWLNRRDEYQALESDDTALREYVEKETHAINARLDDCIKEVDGLQSELAALKQGGQEPVALVIEMSVAGKPSTNGIDWIGDVRLGDKLFKRPANDYRHVAERLLGALENHDGNYKLSKGCAKVVDEAIAAAKAAGLGGGD